MQRVNVGASGLGEVAHNGKHILVEKPMCLTLGEAAAIFRARDDAGAPVLVAYMRRVEPVA